MTRSLLSLVPVLLLAGLSGCASTHQSPATQPASPPPANGGDPAAAKPAHPAPAPAHPAPDPATKSKSAAPADSAASDADETDTPGTPVAREMSPDRAPGDDLPPSVQTMRDQMEDAYQSGLDAWQAGRYDEAKGQFDRAVDVVLSSGVTLSDYPGLKASFDEMVRDIADLDSESFSQEPEPGPGDSGSPLDSLKDITTFLSTEEAEKERQKVQQVVGAITYDIPITLHPKVLAFIEAFQTRIRREFEAGLKRSGGYLPMIKAIFREEGLPEDLAYMAHQESAFKTNAYSRARAKGMWQFMSFTGRKYGLRIDPWVDERCDFEKSTRAAAAYLRDLHERYDDWYLAMAAYNAGEGKIDRAIARSRSRDFGAIARTRYIRAETKSYVPAILASILIDKSPADYGFDTLFDSPLAWETVTVDKPTDLAILATGADTTLDIIRLLNPELRGLVTPPNLPTYALRVPHGSGDGLKAHLETLPDDQRVSWTVYETKSGETFTSVARRYKVPAKALVEANPRYAGRRLSRGTLLNVPLVGGAVIPTVVATEDRPSYEAGERVVHRVRTGDTLHAVAAKYRTTVPNLKRWNNLDGTTIRPGQRLIAYYGERGDGPATETDAPVNVASGRLEYRVQTGDTLSSIARKFSAGLDDLCRWNSLAKDAVIKPGDRLLVGEPRSEPATAGTVSVPHATRPTATGSSGDSGSAVDGGIRHKVKRGDTLTGIARLYDVSVQQVRVWNDLGREGVIYPGQVLRIGAR